MYFSQYVKGNALVIPRSTIINIEEVVSFLQHNTCITKFQLGGAETGNEGAKASTASIFDAIRLKLDNIRTKYMKELNKARDVAAFSLGINNIYVEHIKALANLPHLTSLSLYYNKVDDECAKALASLTNIKELNLYHNEIGDEGAKALANLPSLTELNLGSNKIGDEGAKALANLPSLTELNLESNKIGDEGAKALANLPSLTELNLGSNKIGDEGAKALANLPSLTELDLRSNKIGCEVCEALARSFYVKYVRGDFRIRHNVFEFFVDLYYKNQSIDNLSKYSVKEAIFNVARNGQGKKIVQYILAKPNEYPFLINSRDKHGHTLYHYYTYSPEMQTFLFEHGLIPEKEPDRDTELQNVSQDRQSTHAKPAVEQARFITKTLVESMVEDKDKLEQAVGSYVNNIPKLLEQYQNNPVKLELLGLTDSEKRSVMENVLSNGSSIPNNQDFIEAIINNAKQALEGQYLRRDQDGKYDQGYPTMQFQYDYARDDAKVTIPESIGYIKLHIDKLSLSIPLEERKELLVTLAQQNPELVKKSCFK